MYFGMASNSAVCSLPIPDMAVVPDESWLLSGAAWHMESGEDLMSKDTAFLPGVERFGVDVATTTGYREPFRAEGNGLFFTLAKIWATAFYEVLNLILKGACTCVTSSRADSSCMLARMEATRDSN